MQEKTYTVIIERDEDGMYMAKVPYIVGCHTQGMTEEEAMTRIKEAILSCSKDETTMPLKFVGVRQVQA